MRGLCIYLLVGDARRGWECGVMWLLWLCWSDGGALVAGWRLVLKVVAGKTLVFAVEVAVELVQWSLTAGVSALVISMDWVLLLAEPECLEKVAAGRILVLVVGLELVQKTLSAEASVVMKSMDSVLLYLPKQDLNVGMVLQEVVIVGTSSISGSPSVDSHLRVLPPQISYYSLLLGLDPSTSSSQPSQPVAKFPLQALYLGSLDSELLP